MWDELFNGVVYFERLSAIGGKFNLPVRNFSAGGTFFDENPDSDFYPAGRQGTKKYQLLF